MLVVDIMAINAEADASEFQENNKKIVIINNVIVCIITQSTVRNLHNNSHNINQFILRRRVTHYCVFEELSMP